MGPPYDALVPQPTDAPLRLEPFRAVRFRADLDLAAVTSPPYDVLDDEAVAALLARDPHNVVRLLLPEGATQETRDAGARRTLDAWLTDGTLVVDPLPGLYVYEERSGSNVRLRGVLGALELPGPDNQVVLPHENVMPGPLADRTALQAALEAHIEPIWLVYDGGGPASAIIDATADGGAPVAEAVTDDGLRHRLWAITDPGDLAVVREDLSTRQALVADGHHRYAAYRAVQAQRRAAGAGAGPWDRGLTLLVDLRTHAPEVGAIHRVVRAGIPREVGEPLRDWVAALDELAPGTLLLVDASGAARRVRLPSGEARAAAFSGTPGAVQPALWQALDYALLHEVLLPSWGVSDDAVTYHHTADEAVRTAARVDGVAVLMAPVDVADVLALAAQGVRMPRKSTSFGPKPRSGFVIRTFAQG